MPISLSQIAANTASTTLSIDGETVTVVYLPNKLTDELVAKINTDAIDDNEMFQDLIKSWDIYEDDAQTTMFPISRIGELGIPIKVAIAQAIVGAMSPKVETPA